MANRVLIIGAGPAGISAAISAARAGSQVTVVDDNPLAGGQIWRGGKNGAPSQLAAAQFAELAISGAKHLPCTRVFSEVEPGVLEAEQNGERTSLEWDRLILATGARERFLPFPGWTLPGVTGAGGLQALVKGGLSIEGKRIVIAGSGPLLLAVASLMKEKGAEVTHLLEQAPAKTVRRFGLSLWRMPGKLAQGFALKARLMRVRQSYDSWPIKANGSETIESVEAMINGVRTTIECDVLACGFGLIPNTELAQMTTCNVSRGRVVVDRLQQTSRSHVYCAGEGTGVAGVDKAMLEGEIAGLAAAGAVISDALLAARDKAAAFTERLEQTFALRKEVCMLATPETTVCRCEDVTHGELAPFTSWREAKLHSRCGMGPCQGRVCGGACESLYDWQPSSVRPPILPCPIKTLGNVSAKPVPPPPKDEPPPVERHPDTGNRVIAFRKSSPSKLSTEHSSTTQQPKD